MKISGESPLRGEEETFKMSEELSHLVLELLAAAAEGDGTIMRVGDSVEEIYYCAGAQAFRPCTQRQRAELDEALKALGRKGLIKARSPKTSVFDVTDAGHRCVDAAREDKDA